MVTKAEVEAMIEKSEKNIINVISGSSQIQNQKIDKLIDQMALLSDKLEKLEEKNNTLQSRVLAIEEKCELLEKRNEDLIESIQFTQDELIDKKFKELEKTFRIEHQKLYQNCNYLKERYEGLKETHRKLEDRSRRSNLRIDGVPENTNETWADTEEKVHNIFKNNLEITDDIEIERAHRMGSSRNNQPRTIIMKLLRFKDKERILGSARKLKDTGLSVYEDYSDETYKKRKQLAEKMKIERQNGKYCVIKYDQLIVREFRNNDRRTTNY